MDKSPATNDICQQVLADNLPTDPRKNRVLGRGQCGITYDISDSGRRAALKVPVKDMDRTEIEMLKNVRHKNIVKFYDTMCYGEKWCIVMELADNGNLYNILHMPDKRTIDLTLGLKEQWIQEIACGLEYLHTGLDYPILHGDIKSPNVLIFQEPKYTAKLSDFGLSEELIEGSYTVKGPGTYTARWAAPEAVRSKRTTKSDIWSYGVVVWEILVETKPFNHLDNQYAIVFAVGEGQSPYIPEKDTIPDRYVELLSHCFGKEHSSRWTAKEICRFLDSPWKADETETSRPNSGSHETGPSESGDLHVVSETEKCGGNLPKGEHFIRASARFGREMEDLRLFRKVKFLFKDKIPSGCLDRLKDGHALITCLENHNLVSSNDMEFLRDRLMWLQDERKDRLANLFDDRIPLDWYLGDNETVVDKRQTVNTGATALDDCDLTTEGQVFQVGDVSYTDNMLTEKARFANSSSPAFSGQIDKAIEYDSPIKTVFGIVSERVLGEHFRDFGRVLLKSSSYSGDLDKILSKYQGQRQQTHGLLELWHQQLTEKEEEPTVEKLVSALRAAKLERTASEVAKYMPCPQ